MHTKSKFKQSLFLAVGLDSNKQIHNIAWGVFGIENEDNWEYFLEHLRDALPEVNEATTTFVSDRQKGLQAAADKILRHSQRAFCCQHISENVKARHGGVRMQNWFWKLVKARSETEYETLLSSISETHAGCGNYLREIGRASFTRIAFPGARYQQLTSNIVQSANSWFTEERSMPTLKMLHEIWRREMDRRFSRFEKIQKNQKRHKRQYPCHAVGLGLPAGGHGLRAVHGWFSPDEFCNAGYSI